MQVNKSERFLKFADNNKWDYRSYNETLESFRFNGKRKLVMQLKQLLKVGFYDNARRKGADSHKQAIG